MKVKSYVNKTIAEDLKDDDDDDDDENPFSPAENPTPSPVKGSYAAYAPGSTTPNIPLLPTPEIKQVVNSLLQDTLGTCVYDKENNVFTVELAPWVSEWSLNLSALSKYVHTNTSFSTAQVTARYVEVFLDIPACTWLVPSEALVKIGGVMPDDWPYIRPNKVPQCSNPALTGGDDYVNCNIFPSVTKCQYVTLDIWKLVKSAVIEDIPVIFIEQRNFACAIPSYRVTVNGVETKFSTLEEANQLFDSSLKEFEDLKLKIDIIKPLKKEKVSYLESVLAEKT